MVGSWENHGLIQRLTMGGLCDEEYVKQPLNRRLHSHCIAVSSPPFRDECTYMRFENAVQVGV